MSTARTPQTTGVHLLTNGIDEVTGRYVTGNTVIVAPVEITDPADMPLGMPAEPGLWGEAVRVEDPGGELLRCCGERYFLDEYGRDDYELDPPLVDLEPGPSAHDLGFLAAA